MRFRRLRAITAVLTALTFVPPALADGHAPRPAQHRKLKGRDVAMLFWLPFVVFGVTSTDGKPAAGARPVKRATSARGAAKGRP